MKYILCIYESEVLYLGSNCDIQITYLIPKIKIKIKISLSKDK